MAQLDFPASPAVNDRYPTPAVTGKPQYIWDGEKWTTASGSTATAPPATATPLEDNATPQVGVTTKYAREDHVHPTTALKYTAQTLTTAQQAQSRTNLYAAPFDALAYSGMQINGSMEVSQERGSAGYAPAAGAASYVQDGWAFYFTSAPLTMSAWPQDAAGTRPNGFQNQLSITVGTGKPALAASDQIFLDHKIEGYRTARLGWGTANAQPITIGFYVTATVAGTMTLNIINGAANRWYAANITINAANTWEYKTLTVPGDVAGTWDKTNTTGMYIRFCFGAGATFQKPAGTWTSDGASGTPQTTNFVATTNNVIRITGVVVLPGIEAPSAERSPLIMRPFDQELLTCQRYFYNGVPPLRGVVGSTNQVLRLAARHPVTMRAQPTVAMPVALPVYDGVTPTTLASINASQVTTTVLEIEGVTVGALTVGRPAMIYQGAGGNLNVDARL